MSFRSGMQSKYAKQVWSQLQGQQENKLVELKFSVVKPLGAGWMKS